MEHVPYIYYKFKPFMELLGGGFFFLFSLLFGEDSQIH